MADLEKQERGMGSLAEGKTEEERFLKGVTVLDFDMLCSTVALQSQGKWRKLEKEENGDEVAKFGGVFRMWEGEVLDFFEDRRIFIESACCPCHRFGSVIFAEEEEANKRARASQISLVVVKETILLMQLCVVIIFLAN